MATPRHDSHRFVLAYYGFTLRANSVEAIYRLIIEWCDELDVELQQLGVSRAGRKGGRLSSYKRAHAMLINRGFSDLSSFEIHAGLPDASVPAAEYYVSSVLGGDDDG